MLVLEMTTLSNRPPAIIFAITIIFSSCFYEVSQSFLFESGTGKKHWTYNDQIEWESRFRYCGLRSQSPIDIQSPMVQENADLKLNFFNYERQIKFKLLNAHHTIKLTPVFNDNIGSGQQDQHSQLSAEHRVGSHDGSSSSGDRAAKRFRTSHRVAPSNGDSHGTPSASPVSSSGGYESADEMLFMNKSLPDLMLPVANNNIDNNNRDPSSNNNNNKNSGENVSNNNMNLAPIFSADSSLAATDDESIARLPYNGRPTVKLSTLDDGNNVFHLHDIHLHWGERKDNGSEHAIDGRRGAMEIHLVHVRAGLNKSSIEFNSDSLLVIGIIIDSQRKSNAQFDPIVNSLTRINMTSEAEVIGYRSLLELLPDQLDRFYWYWGSLTTPPCFEVVNWIVMERRLTMNSKQIEMFRQIYAAIDDRPDNDDHDLPNLIVPNIRSLQPLYDRPIFGTKGLGRRVNNNNFNNLGSPTNNHNQPISPSRQGGNMLRNGNAKQNQPPTNKISVSIGPTSRTKDTQQHKNGNYMGIPEAGTNSLDGQDTSTTDNDLNGSSDARSIKIISSTSILGIPLLLALLTPVSTAFMAYFIRL